MSDLDTLARWGLWAAEPYDYNSINSLMFEKEGSGRLVLAYGQAIFAEVTYRFELTSPGILRLTYLQASANDRYIDAGELGRVIVDAGRDGARELKYALNAGRFYGQMNMGTEKGPFTYNFRWVLSLDRPPYPEAAVARFDGLWSAPPYNYYGCAVDEGRR